MQSKLTPSRRLDAIDAEAFEDMVKSTSFRIYQDRLLQELDRKREQLEQPNSEEYTGFIRGAIAALRMALGLREQILSEMKAPKKGKQ